MTNDSIPIWHPGGLYLQVCTPGGERKDCQSYCRVSRYYSHQRAVRLRARARVNPFSMLLVLF